MGILQDSMRTAMETRGYSESTVAVYLYCMRTFANYFRRSPLLISTRAIESFFHFLRQQNKSDSTIHLYHVSLRFFYRINNITDRLANLKFRRIRNKVPVILSQEKIAAILESCTSLKYKALFAMAYASGLRISELRNLTIGDIDFERKQIYVRNGKNGRNRYSILGNKTAQLLRAYMNLYRPYSYVDPREVHMHTFRHCFATHLMENGTSLFHIMNLLGHVSICTTLVYLHMQNLGRLNITSPIDLLEPVLHEGNLAQKELFEATA